MSDIILKADRVLVGEDLNLKEHMAVIVRDGKIEEIVPQAECPAVEGAKVIDLKNTTLMPGMIECHNHLSIDATIPEHLELLAWSTECELTLIALDGFRKDLMSGVTTARCMGDRFYIDVTLKKLIEQGKVAGPKLLAAGIGMKGSHGRIYRKPALRTGGDPKNCPRKFKEGCRFVKAVYHSGRSGSGERVCAELFKSGGDCHGSQ